MTTTNTSIATSIALIDEVTQVTKIETFENGELVKVHGFWGGMDHCDCGSFEFGTIKKMLEKHPEFEGLNWVSDPAQMAKLAGQVVNETQLKHGSRT